MKKKTNALSVVPDLYLSCISGGKKDPKETTKVAPIVDSSTNIGGIVTVNPTPNTTLGVSGTHNLTTKNNTALLSLTYVF